MSFLSAFVRSGWRQIASCLVLTVMVVIALSGCSSSATTAATEIKVAANQKLVYGVLTGIVGNEITIALLDESIQTTSASASSSEPEVPLLSSQLVTRSLTIPVGTDVVTAKGTITTFSRLAANDKIKVLLEQDDDGSQVVVNIWIIENSDTEGATHESTNNPSA